MLLFERFGEFRYYVELKILYRLIIGYDIIII